MAKRKKSEQTYAQQVTDQNDKFRNETYATHLEDAKAAAKALATARKANTQ